MDENTQKEILFNIEDLIVSATDPKGNIIYTNEIFCKVAGYKKEELIGQPHNIIRHEDMPKVVFRLLWDRVLSGKTIYAFVKNKARNGDYYWVKAYIKPVMKDGKVDQIISYRKPLNNFAKSYISSLYAKLLEYEQEHTVDEALEYLLNYLDERNLSYDSFIDRLSLQKSVENKNALAIDVGKLKNEHILFKQHIQTDVAEGKEDVEVIGSCCCGFGKWAQSVSNESFTKLDSWSEVLRFHNHIHEKMQDYVDNVQNSHSEKLAAIIAEVESDVESMFNNLEITIDNSKE